MNKAMAILSLCILTACGATMGAQHTGCMDAYPDFANQVACVKNTVIADPYLRDDTLVREYIMTGDLLAEEVRQGRIGEDEARLQFLQKLNEIENRQLQRAATEARMNRDIQKSFPRHTTCVPAGNGTQCTTY